MEYNGLIFSKISNNYAVGNSKNITYGNGIVNGVDAEGDVIIPKRVNGFLVTEILQQAFRECIKITSVRIDAPIKRIYDSAFYHCALLESIIIPKTVEILEMGVFSMYSVRTSSFLVIFEKGTRIKAIKQQVFEHQVVGLTIVLPVSSLPELGSGMFLGSKGDLNIYTYKKDLNFSGILTKKIVMPHAKLYTCNHKRSTITNMIFLYVVMLCFC